MAILVHIWKSLPFWTLILIAGRLAIPDELYEAASVDGASRWQKFKFITWPSMQTLYLTSTILSMIWTLGDFNSVYLLTGGGPADLTHVLATLGIRYLRLDQVDLVDGGDRLRDAAGAAAGLLHDEAAVAMKAPTWHQVSTEAKLLLVGIPGADLDDAADLPPVPVLDLAEGLGVRRQALARSSDAAQLRSRLQRAALLPEPLLAAALELAADRGHRRRADAAGRDRRGVRDQPAEE